MLTLALAVLIGISLLAGNYLASTVGALGLVILFFEFGGNFSVVGNAIWNNVNSFTLTAVPVFIFLGEVLSKTGLAERIYSALSPLFEKLPGGLLQTNIGTCTVFSATSGSSMATAAAVGSIAFDELGARGYDRKAIVGSVAAGGTLGVLMPPSLVLIVYGAWQSVSIGKLFIGAVIPALLVVAAFMAFIALMATFRKGTTPVRTTSVPLGRALLASAQAWPFALLIFAILGTIFLGLATPTESAALGVVTALLLALAYGSLSFRVLWLALRSTVFTFSSLMLVITAAVILAQAVSLTGIPKQMVGWVAESDLPDIIVLGLIYSLYLVLGCFLGGFEMLLITLPFTFPLVMSLAYDPVWFGIVLVLLIEIGQLTPPLGVNLFVMVSISGGRISLGEAASACIPYWLILLTVTVILTAFPELVLFLPNTFG